MTDDRDDDAPRKTPPTQEEIAEYEQAVRQLIHRRAPFDRHLRFLKERLKERAGQEDGEQ
jgi:hypothetical protein